MTKDNQNASRPEKELDQYAFCRNDPKQRFPRSGRLLVRENSVFCERSFMGEYFQPRKYEKCMNPKHEGHKSDKVMSRRGENLLHPQGILVFMIAFVLQNKVDARLLSSKACLYQHP